MAKAQTHTMPGMEAAAASEPWWRRELPGLAIIAAVVVLVFWPLAGMSTLLITPEGPTAISDMVYGAYPGRLLLGQALAKGHLLLWTDQIFCGFPLLAAPGLGTFYPLNWLFVFLPAPAAMSLVVLLTCMMAGWFTYYYCRIVGLGRAAATVGGMSFAVCGFFASHAKHVAFSSSACWLPLELALVERALREHGRAGARAALWLAPVVTLQSLAGGIQFVYISVLAMLLYALIALVGSAGSDRRWRRLRYALLVLAVPWGLALAAEQILPARELLQVSERAAGLTAREADPYPVPPRDLLTLVSAGAVGRATDFSYERKNAIRGLFWEDYIYAGWPVVVMALVGLPWTVRRRPQARAMLLLGVVGVMLALGQRGALFPAAWGVVPGIKLFRFPERFLLWTEIGTAVLGAMGAEVVLASVHRRRRVAAAALLAVTLIDLTAAEGKQNVYYSAQDWLGPPPTVLALRRDEAVHGQGRAHTVGVPSRLEAINCNRIFLGGGWDAHLDVLFTGRALLTPTSNAIWGMPMLAGYVELVPKWSARIWRGQHSLALVQTWENDMLEAAAEGQASSATLPPGYLKLLGAANGQYLISPWPLRDERLQAIPVGGDIYVYRNSEALGRAYLVPGAEDIRSDDQFVSLQRSGQADFRHWVYVYGRSSPPRGDFSAIRVPARDNASLTRVVLEPDAPAPCWLVLTDAYYPGWSVTVDGKPARLERANCTMRAVELSAGKHRVEFSYRCRPLEVGSVVALVSALLWLAALWKLPRWPSQVAPVTGLPESPRGGRGGQAARTPPSVSRRRRR